jgi:hypothetical protein
MTDPVPAKPAAPAKPVHNTVLPSDIDAQGNVVLWDKGPPADSPEAKAWHDANGAGPAPVVMHNSDASHALSVDPDRWAIEPEGLDAEVEAEVQKMLKADEDAKKAAEARALAIKVAEYRKIAVGAVMAARAAKAAADKSAKAAAPSAKPADVTYVDPPIGKMAL